MRPHAVTLTATPQGWAFDTSELEAALLKATLFLFNDPHNPTGHRFLPAERRLIVDLCRKHGVVIVTDEIYEWILYGGGLHEPLAVLDPENVVIVSSISKTARATGWRIGWVVASASRTQRIRAVHDQLVAWIISHTNRWIVFTAAHPGQPGEGHTANKPPSQWRHDFVSGGVTFDQNKTRAAKRATSAHILQTNLHVFRRH